MSDSDSGTDLIKYSRSRKSPTTERVQQNQWAIEDGMIRMDLDDEILWIPFDRVEWIKREKDQDDD